MYAQAQEPMYHPGYIEAINLQHLLNHETSKRRLQGFKQGTGKGNDKQRLNACMHQDQEHKHHPGYIGAIYQKVNIWCTPI